MPFLPPNQQRQSTEGFCYFLFITMLQDIAYIVVRLIRNISGKCQNFKAGMPQTTTLELFNV